MNQPVEIYFEKRFFKAYFTGSLIYAVVFGCLFAFFGDGSGSSETYSDEEPANPIFAFLFAFLSVIGFSLLNVGMMKLLKRRGGLMIWLSAFLNWLMVVILFIVSANQYDMQWNTVSQSIWNIFALSLFGLPLMGMVGFQSAAVHFIPYTPPKKTP